MSGTSSSRLDQAVKGAAPMGTSTAAVLDSRPSTPKDGAGGTQADPMAALPSSPPQIYLNLLILEASLRSQYLTLRDRRRQNTFFIMLLILWTAYFSWALFLAPREDGSGIGGSVYWVVETGQKVALMGGVVTGILIWGTGQWERGVRWPRRFIGMTNRGLRSMNCKVVVLKGPWWREMAGHLAFLFPWAGHMFGGGPGEYIDFRIIEQGGSGGRTNRNGGNQHMRQQQQQASMSFGDGLDYIRGEDLSSGGDHIKLLLLPRSFSPDFRENWELYRSEYWEKENERRGLLRQKLAELDRAQAKQEGGWLWWTGWRGWQRQKGLSAPPAVIDIEKRSAGGGVGGHHAHGHSRQLSDVRRASGKRAESHSRNASRSSHHSTASSATAATTMTNSTATGTGGMTEERPVSRGSRRGSTVGQDGRRRSTRSSISSSQFSSLGASVSAGSTASSSSHTKRSSLAAPPLTRGDSFTPLDADRAGDA